MQKIVAALLIVSALTACGGGGGSTAPVSSSAPPQNASVPAPGSSPPASNADLALADRLYKGDARTPADFAVESRPAGVTGTLSTRHLRNTDFATGPQAGGPSHEVCSNDLAQALEWSESQATWSGQYSDLVEVNADAQKFEILRVPRADVTALLRHRVFRCDYLDRSGSDLQAASGAAGAFNQRPLTAAELDTLAEYLWQFTAFNNADYVVASSAGSAGNGVLVHTIRMGQLVRGVNGGCDTVRISDWTHTLDTSTGALTRSLSDLRSFQVKNNAGAARSCTG